MEVEAEEEDQSWEDITELASDLIANTTHNCVFTTEEKEEEKETNS